MEMYTTEYVLFTTYALNNLFTDRKLQLFLFSVLKNTVKKNKDALDWYVGEGYLTLTSKLKPV